MELEPIVALAKVCELQSNGASRVFRRVEFAMDASIFGFTNRRGRLGGRWARLDPTYAISIAPSNSEGFGSLCCLLSELAF